MIDKKILDDLLASGWLEDNNPLGKVPTVAGAGDFVWKLKDGAPDEIKKLFEKFQALSGWDNENGEQASKGRKKASKQANT